jgi:hypothetical protein
MSVSRSLGGMFAVWMWALIAAGCGGGAAVLSPHTVPTVRPPAQTEQTILDTLPQHGWVAESVQPGRIVAFLALRTHLLRVEIRYDEHQVAIYYVNSDNLKAHVEADGQVYAHPAVNRWSQNLARDIGIALSYPPPPSAGGQLAPPPSS